MFRPRKENKLLYKMLVYGLRSFGQADRNNVMQSLFIVIDVVRRLAHIAATELFRIFCSNLVC